LPHFYAETLHLPFRLGFVSEFSFQNTRYEENSRRVEVPSDSRLRIRTLVVRLQSLFERALHGPGTRRGWNAEPAMLLRLKRKVFSPSIEYYGEVERINVPLRAQQEVHQVFLGGDWRAMEIFSINMGAGVDLGPRSPGLILKSRFEWDWHNASNSKVP
jgi:hypothetical protein